MSASDASVRDCLRERLVLGPRDVKTVEMFLTSPDNRLVDGLLDVVEKYGGVDEINRRAAEAGRLDRRLERLRAEGSPYLADLEWLTDQRDRGAFVTLPEYRRSVLGPAADSMAFDDEHAVTLEISALQYFPWLVAQARHAIEHRELMPARYIRVRNMAEQAVPGGDVLAVAVAMQILGASHVETLDTRGTDGANVHLGGPDTIAGYFGGIGQPNDYPLRWADEYLYYLTEFGIRQVLNVNLGTIFVCLLLRKLGVECEFKVSVFTGIDNPFSAALLLLCARLLAGEDGSTSLAGLNLSNSADAATLLASAEAREALGLTDAVRFEHHVTEAYRSIVRQPYDRLADIEAVAEAVPNLSAKHEGGEPAVEVAREHPSDIFDYFLSLEEVETRGLMAALEQNYLDKHAAVCRTAAALTRAGIGVRAAALLHATHGVVAAA
jgi:hypothetical protein